MKSSGIIAVAAILMLPLSGVAADNPASPAAAQAAAKPVLSPVEKGKAIAFDTNKGNCLACYMTGDGEFPGNYGPPLIQMKERFPDKAVLRKQVWDATAINPKSIMPPLGKHGILTESEIDQVVEYLYTL
jgi:sulfur-oxidizing protein SoxX